MPDSIQSASHSSGRPSLSLSGLPARLAFGNPSAVSSKPSPSSSSSRTSGTPSPSVSVEFSSPGIMTSLNNSDGSVWLWKSSLDISSSSSASMFACNSDWAFFVTCFAVSLTGSKSSLSSIEFISETASQTAFLSSSSSDSSRSSTSHIMLGLVRSSAPSSIASFAIFVAISATSSEAVSPSFSFSDCRITATWRLSLWILFAPLSPSSAFFQMGVVNRLCTVMSMFNESRTCVFASMVEAAATMVVMGVTKTN